MIKYYGSNWQLITLKQYCVSKIFCFHCMFKVVHHGSMFQCDYMPSFSLKVINLEHWKHLAMVVCAAIFGYQFCLYKFFLPGYSTFLVAAFVLC